MSAPPCPSRRLCAQYEATEQEVTGRGVDAELPLEAPMNLKQVGCRGSQGLLCVESPAGSPAGTALYYLLPRPVPAAAPTFPALS